MKMLRASLLAALWICACWGAVTRADESAGAHYVPYQPSGIYPLGDTVGWHVTLPWHSPSVSYVIRRNNHTEIGRGTLRPGMPARIESKLDEPGMVYVEVLENRPGAKPKALGAAVAPERSSARFQSPQTSIRSGSRRSVLCAESLRSRSSHPGPATRKAWTSPSSG